jgi:hypothetical protein
MKNPKCKRCGKPCQYYGTYGGFSVRCKGCNKKNAASQRKARAAAALIAKRFVNASSGSNSDDPKYWKACNRPLSRAEEMYLYRLICERKG